MNLLPRQRRRRLCLSKRLCTYQRPLRHRRFLRHFQRTWNQHQLVLWEPVSLMKLEVSRSPLAVPRGLWMRFNFKKYSQVMTIKSTMVVMAFQLKTKTTFWESSWIQMGLLVARLDLQDCPKACHSYQLTAIAMYNSN